MLSSVKYVRSDLRYPNELGTVPVNLLLLRYSEVIALQLPNSEGIDPVNALPFKDTCSA